MSRFLFPLILLFVAFFMLQSSGNKIKTHYHLYSNGVTTQGSVISIRTKYRRSKSDLHFLTVSYGAANHIFVLKSDNGLTWPWVPDEGDTVRVIYEANEPEKAEVFSLFNFFIFPVLQFIFGIFCMICGGILLIKNKN
jgi:hypothetical protein